MVQNMKKQKRITLKKEYICEIRNLLPILRREEKAYLQGIEKAIDDFISEEEEPSLCTLEDYYSIFGKPRDVIQEYYSCIEGELIYSCVKRRRLIQKGVLAIGTLLCLGIVFSYVLLLREHQSVMRQETVYITQQFTWEENP